VPACGKFTTKLSGPVSGWVDLATQGAFDVCKSRDKVIQRDPIPHYHNIDVAGRGFGAAGNGAVDECEVDAGGQWLQGRPEDICYAEGLAHQPPEFLEDRAIGVGLVVSLNAFGGPGEDSGAREAMKLALNGTCSEVGQPDNLAEVEALSGVAVQDTEDGLARGAKQGKYGRTHSEYNCTQNGVYSR